MGKCAGLSVRSESRWSCWSDRSTICAESMKMGMVFPLPLLRLDSNMSLPTSWCTIVHPRTWLFQPAVRVPLAKHKDSLRSQFVSFWAHHHAHDGHQLIVLHGGHVNQLIWRDTAFRASKLNRPRGCLNSPFSFLAKRFIFASKCEFDQNSLMRTLSHSFAVEPLPSLCVQPVLSSRSG